MASKYSTNDSELQHNRRISDFATEPCTMLMPIKGYERQPLVTIEEAVEPIVPFVPDVKQMAYVAKTKCKKIPANDLSLDESASLMLYSMEWEPQEECLYHVLNTTLRSENRKKLIPWFLFLKLILTAFARLPSKHCFVYRGIRRDVSKDYPKGETVIWWGFSSCTTTMDVLENDQFLGSTGTRTFITIECTSGKDIRKYSSIKSEDEILLPPGRQFEVVSCLKQSGGLHMIQLKETEPPYPLLEPASKDIKQTIAPMPSPPQSISKPIASSTSIKNTKVQGDEQFATPGSYQPLGCKGRPCANCGKCRDWQFKGDLATWRWIQNYKNWGDKDWKRWSGDKVDDRFNKRPGASCDYGLGVGDHVGSYYGSGYYGSYFYYGCDYCVCDDNF